jgi:hypothetical protein
LNSPAPAGARIVLRHLNSFNNHPGSIASVSLLPRLRIDEGVWQSNPTVPAAFYGDVSEGHYAQVSATTVGPGTMNSSMSGCPSVLAASAGASFAAHSNAEISMRSGTIFLRLQPGDRVRTEVGEVTARASCLVAIDAAPGLMRVRACTGLVDVMIRVRGQMHALKSGCEVTIANHSLSRDEAAPMDNIGRREIHIVKLASNWMAAFGDFSIASMMQSQEMFSMLRRPTSKAEKRVQWEMMKSACALTVCTGARGRYYVRALTVGQLPPNAESMFSAVTSL